MSGPKARLLQQLRSHRVDKLAVEAESARDRVWAARRQLAARDAAIAAAATELANLQAWCSSPKTGASELPSVLARADRLGETLLAQQAARLEDLRLLAEARSHRQVCEAVLRHARRKSWTLDDLVADAARDRRIGLDRADDSDGGGRTGRPGTSGVLP